MHRGLGLMLELGLAGGVAAPHGAWSCPACPVGIVLGPFMDVQVERSDGGQDGDAVPPKLVRLVLGEPDAFAPCLGDLLRQAKVFLAGMVAFNVGPEEAGQNAG